MDIDIVTVFHNEKNRAQAGRLLRDLHRHEPQGGFRFITVDNRVNNRGFSAACNLGAGHPVATAPIIGFVNPDVLVEGSFIARVTEVISDRVVVTGRRFDKPDRELAIWGVQDWVCGATFFVLREWFTEVGGFDERFVWSHEETDLIRTAETQGRIVKSIYLPLRHDSPHHDTPADADYKNRHFAAAQQQYFRKWRS